MSTRSEMCHKTIEECAWELVSEPDASLRLQQRKMMVGEFGEYPTEDAIESADNVRELLGLKRQFLSKTLRRKLQRNCEEHLRELRTNYEEHLTCLPAQT